MSHQCLPANDYNGNIESSNANTMIVVMQCKRNEAVTINTSGVSASSQPASRNIISLQPSGLNAACEMSGSNVLTARSELLAGNVYYGIWRINGRRISNGNTMTNASSDEASISMASA